MIEGLAEALCGGLNGRYGFGKYIVVNISCGTLVGRNGENRDDENYRQGAFQMELEEAESLLAQMSKLFPQIEYKLVDLTQINVLTPCTG